MKAVILTGGKGMRLRPFTLTIPKPLLPVGDKAILENIVIKLKKAGIKDIILSTGHLSEYIKAYCGNGSKWGVTIEYSQEDKPLGTAGPLTLIQDKIENEKVIILMNGDIYTELDFAKMISYHEENGCRLTVGYKLHKTTSAFGTLTIHDGFVTDIIEKPEQCSHISTGIYILDVAAIKYIPRGESFDMPSLIKKLHECGEPVGGYLIEEYWLGIESIDELEKAVLNLQTLEKRDQKVGS